MKPLHQQGNYEPYLAGLCDFGKRYSQTLVIKITVFGVYEARHYHYDLRNPKFLKKVGAYLIQNSKVVAVHMVAFDVSKIALSRTLPEKTLVKREFCVQLGAIVFSNLLTEIIFYRKNGPKAILKKVSIKASAFIIGELAKYYCKKKYPELYKKISQFFDEQDQDETPDHNNDQEQETPNPPDELNEVVDHNEDPQANIEIDE